MATALRKNITVIPVLVQGARMPTAGQLPADIKARANRNALEDARAEVQFPTSSAPGSWDYDEGARTLRVAGPDGRLLIYLRVTDWHQNHFHGQWVVSGNPSAPGTGVNITPG